MRFKYIFLIILWLFIISIPSYAGITFTYPPSAIQNAVVGVEYNSPEQHGGIYGIIYRQYFTTALPSNLTSGSIVSGLIDCCIQLKYTTSSRGLAHGNATAFGSSDNHIYIMLSGASGLGNLSLNKTGYTSLKGWVDYTK